MTDEIIERRFVEMTEQRSIFEGNWTLDLEEHIVSD